MSETQELEFDGLVNRLAQEVARAQRQLGAAQQKLNSTTRSLEVRTQELAQARARLELLQATLDTSQDGILAMGYYGRAMHFNSRFVDIWGIPGDQAASLDDAALLALQMAQVKDPQRFLAISQARRAQAGEERRDVVEMTDGRVLECRVIPQRVRGRRVGSVACWREVTAPGSPSA